MKGSELKLKARSLRQWVRELNRKRIKRALEEEEAEAPKEKVKK